MHQKKKGKKKKKETPDANASFSSESKRHLSIKRKGSVDEGRDPIHRAVPGVWV